jgi:hypothetical protein
MKIKCLTTFLDGKDRFEADDIRTVDDERGARFCANGWAEDLSGAVPTGGADKATFELAVDSVATSVASKVK